MKKLFLLFALLIANEFIFGQDTTGTAQQVWPQLNISYTFNEKFRLGARYQTTRTKYEENDNGNGNARITLDYFAFPWLRKPGISGDLNDSARGHYLWLRLGYYYRAAPKDAKTHSTQNTIITAANSRFHLPYQILLTAQNRVDWSFENGDLNPVYRPRLTFQKDMRTEYLHFAPYLYGEYYVDFKNAASDKFRLCAGVILKVARHLNFETYYLYQFPNGKNVSALQAVSVGLNFYFHKHDPYKLFSNKKKHK